MNFARFSAELVHRRPRGSGGLVAVEQVDSTQILGRRIVEEYSREGTVAPNADLVAWRQVAGRGREGRSWSSPPGMGVYVTLIRSLGGRVGIQTLPLRIAVALCEALNRWLGGRCRVKWPNDLMVGARKLGGILIDVVTRGDEASIATLSFGVNYSAELALLDEPRATSVRHEIPNDAAPSLDRLVLELIDAVDGELALELAAADVVARYEELTVHRPGEVLCCQVDSRQLEGEFRGFDENGFLRLAVGGEERLLSTGEIVSGA